MNELNHTTPESRETTHAERKAAIKAVAACDALIDWLIDKPEGVMRNAWLDGVNSIRLDAWEQGGYQS